MQQTPALTSHDDDEIDLMGLLGTLVDHKWLIAGITAASMVVGTAYAVLATPVYQATALIQVEAKKNDMLGFCLLYTSPSPRDGLLSRMPSSA